VGQQSLSPLQAFAAALGASFSIRPAFERLVTNNASSGFLAGYFGLFVGQQSLSPLQAFAAALGASFSIRPAFERLVTNNASSGFLADHFILFFV
jgi:hypothetical protein